jgi:polyferredoxin
VDPAVDGWREILQPQLLDIALLAAFMTLALVSFFRKSVALKYVTFVAAVGYLGFTKSSLVSVSDVFRLTDLSVPELKYSLAWYLFMTFVVVTTVLWGRVYCGRVCAFGALTQ